MPQTDKQLENLISRYEKHKRPIAVNFRNMVSWIPSGERYTHLIHPYPAKLLMHIPHFFLSNKLLSKEGDSVLDPFCGSGTVLLEALLSQRHGLGVDCNPFARLISNVKTKYLEESKLSHAFERLKSRIPSEPDNLPPEVVNLNYWYYPHIIRQLCCILKAVNGVRNSDMRNFFLICFSSLAKKVSLADPRLTVPVRLKKEQYPEDHFLAEKTKNHLNQLKRINVQNVFFEIVSQNIKRISTLEVLKKTDSESELICSDAKQLLYEFASRKRSLPDKSIQLIITSPPYVGAQKYIRSVSLNLGWIGMCNADQLKDYKYASIGLEEFHKSEYLSQPITGITVYVIY